MAQPASSGKPVADYERANALSTDLGFSRRFCARQRFILGFRTGTLHIQEQGSRPTEYRFEQGRLADASAHEGLRDELMQPLSDARHAVDRANLLYGWLNRNGNTVSYSFS
jgi:hypothetical protein